MYAKNNRSRWTLFLFLLAGMVLGSFLAFYLKRYAFLEWLDYGLPFGLTGPANLSLGVLTLTLGFQFYINIGGVIGLALGVLAFKLSNRL